METIKVQKNQIIAKQKEKVKAWYLILEGSVVQRNSYARIVLNIGCQTGCTLVVDGKCGG